MSIEMKRSGLTILRTALCRLLVSEGGLLGGRVARVGTRMTSLKKLRRRETEYVVG